MQTQQPVCAGGPQCVFWLQLLGTAHRSPVCGQEEDCGTHSAVAGAIADPAQACACVRPRIGGPEHGQHQLQFGSQAPGPSVSDVLGVYGLLGLGCWCGV